MSFSETLIVVWFFLGIFSLGLKWKLSGYFEWIDLLILALGAVSVVPILIVFGNGKKYSDVKLF